MNRIPTVPVGATSIRAMLFLTIALLMAASPASAQKAAELPGVTFEKYTLANGLEVILHVDRKLPIVHVNQWYHVGAKNERPGRTGFAHLFEHMMFQGSTNAPGEYFSYVEKAGGNINNGGVNGTTSFDRTNYFATVPSGNLEYLLWLESDRLATLDEAITQEKLDNQRMVVKNERRQNYENTPYGRAWSLLTQNVYPAGHPYVHDVIGSHEDLSAATLDDVRDFFRTYYTPNNLSIVIAGDFDVAEARRLVEKYFGGIAPGPVLERVARWVPRLDGEKIVEAKDRVPQEAVYIAWPAPPYFDAEEAPLDMAASVLADGLSSRLRKVLQYDRQLVTNVYAFNEAREISGNFVVVAEARQGAELEEIETVITQEIARLARQGPSAEELDRAKTKWEFGYVAGLERIGGFGGKADRLNQYNTFFGTPDRFKEEVTRYRGVTAEHVRAATSKWIDNRNRVVLRFRPETSTREIASTLDRSTAPALGADRPFSVPEVQTAKLENGMEVFVVTRPELPKVSVSLGVRAGVIAEPAGKGGLATLVAGALDDGAGARSALAISDQLGDLGVWLSTGAGRESASAGFESLKRNLDPALAIVADVVRRPTFPPAEFERERAQHLEGLAQEDNDASSVSWRVARMLAFGKDHPYGRPGGGTRSSVAGLTVSDLAEFHRTYWKPSGAALVLVGDVTLEEGVALARKHFGSWSGSAPAVPIPAPTPAAPGRIYLVDRQDASQTVVCQVLPGVARRSGDYYAIELADAVWGGAGFANRLNMNLREDKGYSYGVFSWPMYLREGGMWTAGGGVQTDKTRESIAELMSELAAISSTKPIASDELERARELRLRSFSQEFETAGEVARRVLDTWSFGLPMSEIGREPIELGRTDLDAVNAAARRYLVADKAAVVLVGDRSVVAPTLGGLGLGEVILLDAEGNVASDRRAEEEPRPVPGRQ
ncbi:MAG TPA: pitrilysin family protein [Candidatus Kapabacteria bacterium]|nr:pitrilysin family protein [Candidatus Kapabacteria bacterium]